MRFRASDVATATGGRLHGPDVEIDGVAFDSRVVQPGQLFVPLIAERDGHDFVGAAIAAGAAAYLTSRPPVGGTAIAVNDTLQALMALATAQRPTFTGPVVGITGSVGKTSTKDMLRAALAPSRVVWANERSFNNEQGLPTTLLNTPDGTEVMVLEMGMRGLGQIAELCRIAQPTVGVVTRVAEAHSDRVGGIEGVARAKGELVEALPTHGVAVLNADDHRVAAMAVRTAASVLTVGHTATADVRIGAITTDHHARARFRLESPWGSFEVALGVSGRHMASNAAAALGAVGALGGDVGAGVSALAEVGLTAMRMEIVHLPSGAVILNDSYNANPTSMRAALDALVDLPGHRKVAVLGVMAEISDPEAEHRAIVEYAHGHGIEVLAVGTDLYGLPQCADPVAALGSLAGGEALLVKGSRVAGLERIVALLVGQGA
ncbi:MAG TPA: UDP-N-acetylmuramoylalanyl-D-glutamyl-2, 6-diaminopimelate--D-alanyl-D-alanine ligase [Acidimicrobiaceae bacterium]|nr:UDP-N-acetylmuramoylalanyl-D-glutamyl-2, 6-diaminopimelate--D-alanyl-D-alanine ligase [Acidimicrobiaceae bacterium]